MSVNHSKDLSAQHRIIYSDGVNCWIKERPLSVYLCAISLTLDMEDREVDDKYQTSWLGARPALFEILNLIHNQEMWPLVLLLLKGENVLLLQLNFTIVFGNHCRFRAQWGKCWKMNQVYLWTRKLGTIEIKILLEWAWMVSAQSVCEKNKSQEEHILHWDNYEHLHKIFFRGNICWNVQKFGSLTACQKKMWMKGATTQKTLFSSIKVIGTLGRYYQVPP